MDKLRPQPDRIHSSWQSCCSNCGMTSFLLSTEAKKMWIGHTFWSHLRAFTDEHSDWFWSRTVALFTGSTKPIRKCRLAKCCKAASAQRTLIPAWKNCEWKATALEHMGGELWNMWDADLQRRGRYSTACLKFTCSFSIHSQATQNQKAGRRTCLKWRCTWYWYFFFSGVISVGSWQSGIFYCL